MIICAFDSTHKRFHFEVSRSRFIRLLHSNSYPKLKNTRGVTQETREKKVRQNSPEVWDILRREHYSFVVKAFGIGFV